MRAAAVDHRDGRQVDSMELRRRIKAQLDTLADVGARFIVLGAWGCGAFLAPPALVAQLYREEIARKLQEYQSPADAPFKRIVFAIYHAGYGSDNFAPFEAEFRDFAIPGLRPAASGCFTSDLGATVACCGRPAWQYFDPPSDSWIDYPEESSAALERCFREVQRGASTDGRVWVTRQHFVDVRVLRQFQAHDGSKWRAVQRLPGMHSSL